MRQPVTADLLHRLVSGAHAEGNTTLAVAAIIEHHDHVLLVHSGDGWQTPGDLVLPGEGLDDAVYRTASAHGGVDHVSDYLGHHDHICGGDVVRTFAFAATTRHPGRARRGDQPGRWTPLDDLPDDLDHATLRFVHLAALPVHADRGQTGLPAALRAHARGLLAQEAAVELLIGHRCWLHRDDFINGYVDLDDHADPSLAAPTVPTTIAMAYIDWPAAITALDTAALPCSSSQARMLRIAASLADGIPVDLRDALTSLHPDNLNLVIKAALHIAGTR